MKGLVKNKCEDLQGLLLWIIGFEVYRKDATNASMFSQGKADSGSSAIRPARLAGIKNEHDGKVDWANGRGSCALDRATDLDTATMASNCVEDEKRYLFGTNRWKLSATVTSMLSSLGGSFIINLRLLL